MGVKGEVPEQEDAVHSQSGNAEQNGPNPVEEREGGLPRLGLMVVGIGASAGGLTALQHFFDALPPDSGAAFVVVTHLDPTRESHLHELIQSHTQMPVRQVWERTEIAANHVYVLPPNRHIVVTDAHLDVEEFDEPRGQRTPIDTFFRSLAAARRNCAAVILSGSGTDGAVGVKAIKEQGGLLLVQHPDEAEHGGMPRAAIATGLADVVLPVRELAEKLHNYRQQPIRLPQNPEELTGSELDTLNRILTQVQSRTGHDLTRYKHSTVLRRIQRRMQLTGTTTIQQYLDYMRPRPDEARALFNDLLIGVTNFFRDREAWDVREPDLCGVRPLNIRRRDGAAVGGRGATAARALAGDGRGI